MEKPEIKPEEDRKKKIDIKIQMILKEIIDSEKKYVKTLTTIVEVEGLVKIDKQFFERSIDFHFQLWTKLNLQAVGLDSWVQAALKSILKGDPIFESAARFFIIIIKFILKSIFGIKIYEKNSLTTKKISFSKADFW